MVTPLLQPHAPSPWTLTLHLFPSRVQEWKKRRRRVEGCILAFGRVISVDPNIKYFSLHFKEPEEENEEEEETLGGVQFGPHTGALFLG